MNQTSHPFQKRSRLRLLPVCLLALTGPLAANAQTAAPAQIPSAAPDNRAFTLQPHFDRGQVIRFQTEASLKAGFKANGSFYSLSVNSGMRYKALEVRPDGTCVLSVLSDGAQMLDASDTKLILPKENDNAPRAVTLDRQGRVTGQKDGDKGASAGPLNDTLLFRSTLLVPLHLIALPDRPVKIGDTWTARYPPPGAKSLPPASDKEAANADNDTALRAEMTLLGTEKVDGQETLKIRQIVTLPAETLFDAQGKIVSDVKKATGRIVVRLIFKQTVNVLADSGQMVRSQGDIEGTIKFEGDSTRGLPGDTMTLSGRLAALRLPDGVTPDFGQPLPLTPDKPGGDKPAPAKPADPPAEKTKP